MNQRTVAVAITTREHGTVVKRVRRALLPLYEREGWHPVPRRRFRVAKRTHERMAGA